MSIIRWGLAATGVLVLGGAIGLGVFGGGSTAQADDSPTATANGSGQAAGHYEDLLAQRLGIPTDKLKTTQQSALDALVDEAVAAGKLTADEGAKLKSLDLPSGAHGPRSHLDRAGGHLKKAVSNFLDAAAKTIGISKDDLKANLKQGKSLAQIAADHNVSRDQLKSGITTNIQAQIQAMVASGKLTQQQADHLSSGLSKHLDKLIDRTAGSHRGRLRGSDAN